MLAVMVAAMPRRKRIMGLIRNKLKVPVGLGLQGVRSRRRIKRLLKRTRGGEEGILDRDIPSASVFGVEVGLKQNADGETILCITSEACGDSTNIRSATVGQGLGTAVDFVPAGKILAPIKPLVKFKRWKAGDAIDKPLPDGTMPSWDVVRSRYWKSRAGLASDGEFSKANLRRMRRGRAPLDYNPRTGKYESRELHHVQAQRNGGENSPINIREVTPDQHGAVDPFRHTVPTTRGTR